MERFLPECLILPSLFSVHSQKIHGENENETSDRVKRGDLVKNVDTNCALWTCSGG